MIKRWILIFALICAVVLGLYWLFFQKKPIEKPRTWDDITKDGTLHIVTEYNATGFYVEGDSLAGFQYEMAKAFAQQHNLKLEITPEMLLSKQMEGLCSGKYDILANNLLVTSENKDSILLFSNPIVVNKQVLVQRTKPENDSLGLYISSPLQLGGKTICVTEYSPVIYRIQNLSEEMGDTIHIREIKKYGAEQLLAMVAHGDIDYAVCDKQTAQQMKNEIEGLDISQDISFNQFYSWGVHRSNKKLLQHINEWLEQYIASEEFAILQKKYLLD